MVDVNIPKVLLFVEKHDFEEASVKVCDHKDVALIVLL